MNIHRFSHGDISLNQAKDVPYPTVWHMPPLFSGASKAKFGVIFKINTLDDKKYYYSKSAM